MPRTAGNFETDALSSYVGATQPGGYVSATKASPPPQTGPPVDEGADLGYSLACTLIAQGLLFLILALTN
jgi:hypothetical protein